VPMDRARACSSWLNDLRHPPGPQVRFTVEEVARGLDVPVAMVGRWIAKGWLRARRVFRDWAALREASCVGYWIRGSAVTRAMEHPQVAADRWREKTRRLERGMDGGMNGGMEVARPPSLAPQNGRGADAKTTPIDVGATPGSEGGEDH